MTEPKVSEKQMLATLATLLKFYVESGIVIPDLERDLKNGSVRAIRAAIEEGGRLRTQIEKWQKEAVAIFANLATGTKKTQRKELENALMLLQELRYFKLDGEGEK
jgi:hypothetical protein